MKRKILKEVIRKEIRKLFLNEVSLTIINILPTAPRPRYRSWNTKTDLTTWERQAQKRYGATWGYRKVKLVPQDKEFRTKAT